MNFRRTVLTLSILSLMFASAPAFSDDLADRVQSVKNQLDVMFPGTPETQSLGDSAAGEHRIKCGTPALQEAMALQERYGMSLGFAKYFSRPDDVLPETFDSPGGHFEIHYTTAGTDSVFSEWGDHNSNGVNDYVEIVARIADSVWVHHIDQLGYQVPLNDSVYSSGGGDSRYDIYIKNVGSWVYGYTQPDKAQPIGNGKQATSWMAVHNNYRTFPGYSTRPIEALQVTIAHEFFHAIQFSYDATESLLKPFSDGYNAYWMEMSAVYMEESTYDRVNDYYYYLSSYLPYVHQSLRSKVPENYPYGAGLFPIFLAQAFGDSLIKKCWERCADHPYGNFLEGAIQEALAEVTGGARDFASVWAEYSRWLYFTGTRKPSFFEEGGSYWMIPTDSLDGGQVKPYIRVFSAFPVTEATSADYVYLPEDLGINYIDFRMSPADSVFTMRFKGATDLGNPHKFEWRVSVMAYDRWNSSEPVWVADSLYRARDIIEVKDFQQKYTDIVVVPTLANTDTTRSGVAYRFSVTDTSIILEENKIKYGPTKLLDVQTTPLTISVEAAEQLDATVNIFTVGGEKIYTVSQAIMGNDSYPFKWSGVNQDGHEVASGVYIVQVRLGDSEQTFKVLVIR